MARTYELKRRAERMEETRRRIVRATVDLHTTLGPARTTVAAIAERAGVQRHTVYAHFPDTPSLFAACSQHWMAENPEPDPAAWAAIRDPRRRLRRALGDVYAWYERVEEHLALFARDATLVPGADFLRQASDRRRAAAADLLADGLRGASARAAVGHALEFETWRSLCRRQGLSRRGAVDLMVRLVTKD